jgi:hypothetical protein
MFVQMERPLLPIDDEPVMVGGAGEELDDFGRPPSLTFLETNAAMSVFATILRYLNVYHPVGAVSTTRRRVYWCLHVMQELLLVQLFTDMWEYQYATFSTPFKAGVSFYCFAAFGPALALLQNYLISLYFVKPDSFIEDPRHFVFNKRVPVKKTRPVRFRLDILLDFCTATVRPGQSTWFQPSTVHAVSVWMLVFACVMSGVFGYHTWGSNNLFWGHVPWMQCLLAVITSFYFAMSLQLGWCMFCVLVFLHLDAIQATLTTLFYPPRPDKGPSAFLSLQQAASLHAELVSHVGHFSLHFASVLLPGVIASICALAVSVTMVGTFISPGSLTLILKLNWHFWVPTPS